MSCPKFRSLGSWVLMAVLVVPAVARPTQDIQQDDVLANQAEGSRIVTAPKFQKNVLRFMSESSAEPDVQDLRTTSARDRNVIPEARLPQAATLGRSSNENILVPDGDGEILERRTRPGLGEDDDVLTPGREKTISETLSKLTDAGGKSGYHGADHGSCLIAIIFEAVKVPDDTLERLEDQDPDLHGRENEIWEQLLDMMALDFLPMDDDEEDDEEEDEDDEEYDDDYYDDYYDDYDYDCEEGTECDDDTASANDFSVISFSPMMT